MGEIAVRAFRFAAAVALVLCAGVVPARAQAPLDTVVVAWPGVVADAAFVIADRKGYFRDAGIDVKFVKLDSGAAMIAPLGTGEIDAAGGAPGATLYNAISSGIDIKIVADRGTDTPGYGYNVLCVRKDLVTSGRYKKLADLKGMKLAEPSKGSSTLPLTVHILAKAGLKYDDVQHVFLSFPAMFAAFGNGGIDAADLAEPFATQSEKLGLAVKIAPNDTMYPNQQISVLLYGNAFVEKRPEVARRFMVAYVRALRYYADGLVNGHLGGAAGNDIIGLLNEALKPADVSILHEMTPSGIDPTGHVNMKSLAADYQIYKQFGFLSGEVALNKVVDMSFVDYANRVLGRYQPARR